MWTDRQDDDEHQRKINEALAQIEAGLARHNLDEYEFRIKQYAERAAEICWQGFIHSGNEWWLDHFASNKQRADDCSH